MSPFTNKTKTDQLLAQFASAIRFGTDCEIAPDVCIEIDEGGRLSVGDRVSIRRGTTIQVHRGATVVLGDDVAIGENSFISAMIGIRIGDGVGISNMVDFHDHNHRERLHRYVTSSKPVPWNSGFAGAPIIIESGAVLSNKVSVTTGVRIGQNSIIGANSTVTRSIPPNTVAVGSPATAFRTFDGPLTSTEDRQTLKIAWFGTSIMEHLEGYNTRMFTQSNLPAIGSSVTVEAWRNRGYVERLRLALQVRWPHLQFIFDNYGKGGATSRDVCTAVADTMRVERFVDLAFLSCGLNDVWRGFQGRDSEAVDSAEFEENYRQMLTFLMNKARNVICLSETPFGWDDELDVDAMNVKLVTYNSIAARVAADAGAQFIDVFPAFNHVAQTLNAWSPETKPEGALWIDGVHLSDLGDALVLQLIEQHLSDNNTIANLAQYEVYERSKALKIYGALFRGEQ